MKILCSLIPSLFLATTLATPALAQITVDGTTNTSLTPLDNGVQIDNGNRAGGNLFHSFGEFSVPTSSEAFFNNASDIVNIFSRVTGGNISNIDGLLRANGTANLYMINPAGIIFGENASLQIGGSFYGSTADSIVFSNGEFSATDLANPPLITINAPLGLGIRDNPGNIVNRSTANGAGLFVNEGENISLIGGNISIENGGILFAPGGRIELGGLIEAGTVNFNQDGSLTFPDGVARGDVSVTDFSVVAVFSGGEGSIGINANNFELSSGSNFFGGILADSGAINAQARDIVINATDSVVIDGQGNSGTSIFAAVNTNSLGNAGNLDITTSSLIVNGASILLNSDGQGNAGNITISASDFVLFDNAILSANLSASTSENVNAGDINITTGSLTANNATLIRLDSNGQGNAGNITINARDFVLVDNAIIATNVLSLASENANAGDINLTAGSLTLNNASFLSNNSVLGNGGNVIINASDTVSLTNASVVSVFGANEGSINIDANSLEIASQSNLFAGISVDSGFPHAQAGDIVINLTGDILIDGASNDLTNNQTSIQNVNFGTGNAGNIVITAKNVDFINGGDIFNSHIGQGDLGNVTITASGDITFDGVQNSSRSGISYFIDEEVTGDIGSIEITANNLTVNDGALIQSLVAGNVNSGDINLNIANNILINGTGEILLSNGELTTFRSEITSFVGENANGNSGDINITTGSLSIENGGLINSDIAGQGNAGNIQIDAANFVSITDFSEAIVPSITRTFPSSISASVLFNTVGDGGNIEINTTDFSINNRARVDTSSVGQGDAGNIILNATNTFVADTNSFITSNIGTGEGELARGRVGNISITARDISLGGTSQIQAGAFSGGTVEGTGIVSLTAIESISLTGRSTGILTNNDSGSFGNSSNTQLSAPTITLTDRAIISSDNAGQGDAGSIVIASDKFTANNSFISTNIGDRFGAPALGRVGNIEITAREISFNNTAQIQAGAFSGATAEDAGIVSVTATESISFTGNRTGIFTNNDPGSFGNASNTQLFSPTITLNDSASISVSNNANGQGGNLTIEAEKLTLTNDARILANAAGSGNGGNITLNITEDITFRDNSFISARAFEDANGGNLDIDARFIIAFPSRGNGNDIIATAERGNGGIIDLNARQIFNLQPGKAIDAEGNFLPNNRNDIDASSQTEGLDGTVAINNPDVDPLRGATELPANPISAEIIANHACAARESSEQQNSFILEGKGGIPPVPTATFSDESLLTDGESIQGNLSRNENVNESINSHYITSNIKPFETDKGNIYPARGIIKTADGKIILTAYTTDTKNTRTPNDSLGCS